MIIQDPKIGQDKCLVPPLPRLLGDLEGLGIELAAVRPVPIGALEIGEVPQDDSQRQAQAALSMDRTSPLIELA